jgi:hypothetical protein
MRIPLHPLRATCPDHLGQLDFLILVINASALYMEIIIIKSLLMSTFCNQNKLQYNNIHRTLHSQSRETTKYGTENDCAGEANINLPCPTERQPIYTVSRCIDSRLPIVLSFIPLITDRVSHIAYSSTLRAYDNEEVPPKHLFLFP